MRGERVLILKQILSLTKALEKAVGIHAESSTEKERIRLAIEGFRHTATPGFVPFNGGSSPKAGSNESDPIRLSDSPRPRSSPQPSGDISGAGAIAPRGSTVRRSESPGLIAATAESARGTSMSASPRPVAQTGRSGDTSTQVGTARAGQVSQSSTAKTPKPPKKTAEQIFAETGPIQQRTAPHDPYADVPKFKEYAPDVESTSILARPTDAYGNPTGWAGAVQPDLTYDRFGIVGMNTALTPVPSTRLKASDMARLAAEQRKVETSHSSKRPRSDTPEPAQHGRQGRRRPPHRDGNDGHDDGAGAV